MAVKVIDIHDRIDHTDDMRKRHKQLVLKEAMKDPSAFALRHQLQVASAQEGSMAKVELPPKREYRLSYGFSPFGERGRGAAQSGIPQEAQDQKGEQDGEGQGEEGGDQDREGREGEGSSDGAAGQGDQELRMRRGMEIGRLNENQQPGGQAQFGLGKGKERDRGLEEGPAEEGGEKAGKSPGEDKFSAEFPIDDLRNKISDDFEFPELDPKDFNILKSKRVSRTHGVRTRGPLSQIHANKTMEKHRERLAVEGKQERLEEEEKRKSWREEDFRFRRKQEDEQDISNLVIFLCHDSSGSMTKPKLEIIQALAMHWIRAGRKTHQEVRLEFITFDTEATAERTEAEFLFLESSGGTKISSGSDMVINLTRQKYDPQSWNSMVLFFTDGENEYADMPHLYESFKKICEFAKFLAYYEVMASTTVISTNQIARLANEEEHFVPFSIKEKRDAPEAFRAVIEAIKEANRKKEAIYA